MKVGTLTGNVASESNPTSLEGILVVVEGTSLFGVTDTNGNYTIPDVPAQTFLTVFTYRGSSTTPDPTGVNFFSVAQKDNQGRLGVYIPAQNQTVVLPTLIPD